MAVISIAVRIGSVTAPAGRRLDGDELRRRVELELGELLAREPLRFTPRDGTLIAAPTARVHAASASTPASAAHAIARRIHAELQTRGPAR